MKLNEQRKGIFNLPILE